MKIQKLLRLGILTGAFVYGVKACQNFEKSVPRDLISVGKNAKMLVKKIAPSKYDSLLQAGRGEVNNIETAKIWIDTEVKVLDSLNNLSNYNKAYQGMQ